jgi:hypothetical protein
VIEAIFEALGTILAVAPIVAMVGAFAVIPACLWPDDASFLVLGEIVIVIALCHLTGLNTGGMVLAAPLYVLLVALPINHLLSDLVNHFTPSRLTRGEKATGARENSPGPG